MSDELNKKEVTKTTDCGCGCNGSGECGDQAVDNSRRRLAAATFATPIVASLLSRPVWATGNGGGCGVSGFLSGNLSSPGGGNTQCAGKGCSPGFWKSHPQAWSTGFYKSGSEITIVGGQHNGQTCWDFLSASVSPTLWDTVFPGIPAGTSGVPGSLRNPTLLEVLHGAEGSLQFHVVAALLNSEYHPGYGTSAEKIIEAVNYAFFPPATETRSSLELQGELQFLLDNYNCQLSAGPAQTKFYKPSANKCKSMDKLFTNGA